MSSLRWSCAGWMLGFVVVAAAPLEAEVVQAVFRADTAFPQYVPLWWDGWPLQDEKGDRVRHGRTDMPLGGYLQVYIRNDGDRPIAITDILLEGVSVARAIAPEDPAKARAGDNYVSSLQFSKLPRNEIEQLIAAGSPVWWKADPPGVPPGGMGEVTVRLRRQPKTEMLQVRIVADKGTLDGRVGTKTRLPWVESISFSPSLDHAILYARHPSGKGIAPKKILADGQDVTGRATIVADEAIDLVPIVVALTKPVHEAQYHCFQAVYEDGTSALAGIRVWEPEFRYGMWGGPRPEESPEKTTRSHLARMRLHNVNTLMWTLGDHVLEFSNTDAGRALLKEQGIRLMHHVAGFLKDPLYLFLTDEPDSADFGAKAINPPQERLGSLAQSLVEKGRRWRTESPETLQLLNTDGTFQPEEYYTYAQLADVACFDRYYNDELQAAFERHPADLGAMTKPTTVYAAGEVVRSACAPKPMHVILTAAVCNPGDHPFRAPTRREKRVEVYYALAAGAKGLSYWWYSPYGDCPGVGGDYPGMPDLLNEIGILGAEVRTAGPVLSRACPANLSVHGPRSLWTRALAASNDTIVLIVVNDNIAFDRRGAVTIPVEKARIEVVPPAWLEATSTFEIGSNGTQDVSWKKTGNRIALDLGTVELTRLIILTSDAGLRRQIQTLYQERFAANIGTLMAEKARLDQKAKN